MERPHILILGKLPPPYMGPAVATKIILESDLKHSYELMHFDTRINSDVSDIGALKLSKIGTIRALYKAFRQRVKVGRPDLVLVPIGQTSAGFFKDLPFIRMAADAGAKVLVQLRGSEFRDWYNGLDPLRKSFVKSQLKKASGAIVLGENLRWIFEGFFPEDSIFVVPNGGDYSFPERKNKVLRITYLANFLPGKGLLELLKALTMLAEKKSELPPYEFHAFGSWNNEVYRASCIALADKLNHCYIYGAISGGEKWQAMADSDIFVFAPKSPEGHPWSIVEALAAGLPIVSTDRGAIGQSVLDGTNGFLLPNPDPKEIARALEKLLLDNSLRNKMGAASLHLYETQFTSSIMAENLGNVFEQILHVAP
jgi:glycosyltransferase involved in cell wall biosynthesis